MQGHAPSVDDFLTWRQVLHTLRKLGSADVKARAQEARQLAGEGVLDGLRGFSQAEYVQLTQFRAPAAARAMLDQFDKLLKPNFDFFEARSLLWL